MPKRPWLRNPGIFLSGSVNFLKTTQPSCQPCHSRPMRQSLGIPVPWSTLLSEEILTSPMAGLFPLCQTLSCACGISGNMIHTPLPSPCPDISILPRSAQAPVPLFPLHPSLHPFCTAPTLHFPPAWMALAPFLPLSALHSWEAYTSSSAPLVVLSIPCLLNKGP